MILHDLILSGGPTIGDYNHLDRAFANLSQYRNEFSTLYDQFKYSSGDVFNSILTMQGHVCIKPHGYHGDFEIIDRIYQNYIAENATIAGWDRYFHAGTASIAVRNRKKYFIDLLRNSDKEICSILNVASGPCRDVLEAYQHGSMNEGSKIVCVESDINAITYAKNLLTSTASTPTFYHGNAFRYKDTSKYDLIWSAGLFDYLSDRAAVLLLKRLNEMTAPGGRMVIGNFSNENTQRSYMEFGGWELIHRTQNDLLRLIDAIGISRQNAFVEAEPSGVNLFLIVEK